MIIGIWGALAVFWNTVFMLFIDKVGRRKLLIPSLFGTGAAMCVEATLARYFDFGAHTADSAALRAASPAALRAAIAMFFVFSFFFTALGMISWVYQSEIFPTPIRARGSSVATATNWSLNLVFAQCSPIALTSIKYKYFYCFVGFNWAAMILVWAFYPETVGRSLEEVEEVFSGQVAGGQMEQPVVTETNVVGTAPRSQIRHKGLHPLSMHPIYDKLSIKSIRSARSAQSLKSTRSASSGSEKGIVTKEV